MSFEGARFCSYDSPRALSYTVSLSFPPPLYRCISLLSYLSFTHSLTPFSLAPSPPPSGSFYWAALKPDVPVLRGQEGRRGTAVKGRGDQMTCSFTAAHSPHNRLTFLHPLSLFFFFTLYFQFSYPHLFYFPISFPGSCTHYAPKTHPHTQTKLLYLPSACHVMQAT